MRKALKAGEVYHFFANQTQAEGYCGNVKFRDDVFYSYSTAMGEIVTNHDGVKAIILNRASYSNSTSKHQGKLSYAVHNWAIKLNYPAYAERGSDSLRPYNPKGADLDAGLVNHVHDDVAELLIKASRARTKKDYYEAEANALLCNLKAYADFFGLVYEIPADFDALKACIVEQLAAAKKHETEMKAARILQQAESLQKWREGGALYGYFENTALRLSADKTEIETSRGASIPTDHAVKIWPVLKRCHDQNKTFTPSADKSIYLGHFTLNSFDGKNLIVGCHTIPFNEVLIIANQLGLN